MPSAKLAVPSPRKYKFDVRFPLKPTNPEPELLKLGLTISLWNVTVDELAPAFMVLPMFTVPVISLEPLNVKTLAFPFVMPEPPPES